MIFFSQKLLSTKQRNRQVIYRHDKAFFLAKVTFDETTKSTNNLRNNKAFLLAKVTFDEATKSTSNLRNKALFPTIFHSLDQQDSVRKSYLQRNPRV